jgi:hypothetical protein
MKKYSKTGCDGLGRVQKHRNKSCLDKLSVQRAEVFLLGQACRGKGNTSDVNIHTANN